METITKYPPKQKTTKFQIRWNEPLGEISCPYAYRWVFIFFGFSIRIHKWLRSEPIKHQHDHAWNFLTICLKGGYIDVSKDGIDKFRIGSIRYRKATHIHNIVLPKGKTCWTLLLCAKPKRKWGFWVDGILKRPLKYFHKYGHHPCN